MIKVAALTSGQFVPSTRFRIRQHISSLKTFGIDVQEYIPAISKYASIPGWPRGVSPLYGLPFYALWQGTKLTTRLPGLWGSWRSQITWIGRTLLPGYFTLEPLLKNPLVLDIDDAIWLDRPFGTASARAIAKRADVAIAGNSYLANWFADYVQSVYIVPTAIDTQYFYPRSSTEGDRQDIFSIGWTGSAATLPYLEAMEKPLKQFLDRFANTQIIVVADRPPVFPEIPSDRVRYIPWSVESEAAAVRQMDVGLMPLPNNNWTRGKCSFKMLQYMACGLPVIVSPVGMNAEVLSMGTIGLDATSDSDWYEALTLFYQNQNLCHQYGQNGRAVVEKNFSQSVVVEKLAHIFATLGG